MVCKQISQPKKIKLFPSLLQWLIFSHLIVKKKYSLFRKCDGSSSDSSHVSCLLHLQLPALYSPDPPHHLDLLYRQNSIQGKIKTEWWLSMFYLEIINGDQDFLCDCSDCFLGFTGSGNGTFNLCLGVCLFVCLFVCPIIIQKPLDRFASYFDWVTQESHGNVLSLVLRFWVEGVDFNFENIVSR